jgi:hypothetical protein
MFQITAFLFYIIVLTGFCFLSLSPVYTKNNIDIGVLSNANILSSELAFNSMKAD